MKSYSKITARKCDAPRSLKISSRNISEEDLKLKERGELCQFYGL